MADIAFSAAAEIIEVNSPRRASEYLEHGYRLFEWPGVGDE